MPPQQAKPIKSLKARYGDRLRKAHEAVKDKPVEVRAGDLPGGINNGIAKLTKLYFAEYQNGDLKGQPYCMGVGICVFPKEHAGGRTTFGPEPICDTPNYSRDKTLEDHIKNVENVFKALGADMSNTDADDAMEVTAAALQDADPPIHFRFSTNTGKPNQNGEVRIWHNWGESCEWEPEGDAATDPDHVQDDTPEPDPEPVAKAAAKPGPAAKGPAKKPAKPDLSDSTDTDALLAAANDAAGDEQYAAVATVRLMALAVEAGHEESAVNEAQSWEAVVELINNPPTADEPEPEPEPEGWKKDDLCDYKPVDPKTKKPGKAVLCEIIKIDAKGEKVDLRSTVNKKQVWTGIPVEKIETAS